MANKYANLTGTNQIRDEYNLINEGFEAVEQDVSDLQGTDEALDQKIEAHKSSMQAHDAAAIKYNGTIPSVGNAQQAIDYVDSRIDTIITGGGEGKDPELTDIKTPDPSYTPKRTITAAGDIIRDMQQQFSEQLAEKANQTEVDELSLNKAEKAVVEALQVTKADVTYVEELVASVADGTPEAFPNLAAIEAAYPNGDSYVKINLEDGYVYKWNGTNWEQGWVYQSTKLGENEVSTENLKSKSVTLDKIGFIDTELSSALNVTPLNVSIDVYPADIIINTSVNNNYKGVEFELDSGKWYRVKISGQSNKFKLLLMDVSVVGTSGIIYRNKRRLIENNDEIKEYVFYNENADYGLLQYTTTGLNATIQVWELSTPKMANIEIAEVEKLSNSVYLPIENIIKNGDFTDGLNNWSSIGSTLELRTGGVGVVNTNALDPRIYQNTNVPVSTGHKYYISVYVKSPSYFAKDIRVILYNTSLVGTINTINIESPEPNKLYHLSGIIECPSNWTGNIRLSVQHTYDSVPETPQEIIVSKVLVVDLSETFGLGIEPPVKLMDNLIETLPDNWFDGVINAFYSPLILKSISELMSPDDVYQVADGGALVKSTANPNWSGWSQERLAFGINKNYVPVPFQTNSQLISPGTIIAGGSNTSLLRWGFHVFEGYASDNKSRITMLVNKHTEEGKRVAELYYYLATYDHSNAAYGWYRLGSDVKDHSFLFSRDKAIAFGEWDLRNVMTLARINTETDLIQTYETIEDADAAFEAEGQSINNAKAVLYLALKNAQNGAMFYDVLRDQIVVKKDGKWCDLNVTEVPEGTYNF